MSGFKYLVVANMREGIRNIAKATEQYPTKIPDCVTGNVILQQKLLLKEIRQRRTSSTERLLQFCPRIIHNSKVYKPAMILSASRKEQLTKAFTRSENNHTAELISQKTLELKQTEHQFIGESPVVIKSAKNSPRQLLGSGDVLTSTLIDDVITPAVVHRRRRRPRLSQLNTDKKMWTTRMSSDTYREPEVEAECPAEYQHQVSEQAPTSEVLIRAFGYNPYTEAFRKNRTEVHRQASLEEVKVSTFSRSQIRFDQNEDDEFNIVHQGSSTLYTASKDETDVLVKDYSQSSGSSQDVLREARILSLLDGTSVAPRLHGVLVQGLLEKEYCIVQDKCEGFLSLTQLMISGYYISKSAWAHISLNLARHLQTLHRLGVLHNNICPDNVLVHKDSLEVKLVGFSHASHMAGVHMSSPAHLNQGVSPEVRLGCVTSTESDVFALGYVLQQIMVESRVMSLHQVVLKTQQDLPKDRCQTDNIVNMILENVLNMTPKTIFVKCI